MTERRQIRDLRVRKEVGAGDKIIGFPNVGPEIELKSS